MQQHGLQGESAHAGSLFSWRFFENAIETAKDSECEYQLKLSQVTVSQLRRTTFFLIVHKNSN